MREFEWYTENRQLRFHVCLTTYETIIIDASELGNIKWVVLMVDEAHRLKNTESKWNQTLSEFTHYHRILITGTPLQVRQWGVGNGPLPRFSLLSSSFSPPPHRTL